MKILLYFSFLLTAAAALKHSPDHFRIKHLFSTPFIVFFTHPLEYRFQEGFNSDLKYYNEYAEKRFAKL